MTASTTRVAIHGAGGRMGRSLIEASQMLPGLKLGAAFERADHSLIGQDAGTAAALGGLGVAVGSNIKSELKAFDTLVDFTRPEPGIEALEICRAAGKSVVIGTTGFDAAQKQKIEAAAKEDRKSTRL